MYDFNRTNQTEPSQPPGGYGWNTPTDPTQLPYGGMPPSPPPSQNNSNKPSFFSRLLLVVLCLLVGFGGGFAANYFYGEGTVIYKTVEPSEATPTGDIEKPDLSAVATDTINSVVSITTENLVVETFFGDRVVSGAGSGVIISEDGTIVTNNHVIEDAHNIKVQLQNGEEYPARFIGSDPYTDVGVIKIDAPNLQPAILGDSDTLSVGDFCIAIGNPMGTLGGTVTDGIISALDRHVTIDDVTMTLLQMSAAVSPGNSGGGLFNAQGELIGIVNAKSSEADTEGLGFSIPINTAAKVAEQLITEGSVTGRPALGITATEISSETQAAEAGVDTVGVYVSSVSSGGAADRAGLRKGDRIAAVNDETITTLAELTEMIQKHEVGDTLNLTIVRGQKEASADVVLQEQ